MKKVLVLVSLGVFSVAVAAAGAAGPPASARQHLFVGFGHAPGAAERALVQRYGGTVRFSFPEVDALAIDLSSAKVGDLARAGGVSYVEQDPVREPLSLATQQLVPSTSNGLYGLLSTNATTAQSNGYTGSGVKACLADTGIDKTHVDITGNWGGGYDAFAKDNDPDVGNSATETHATHVAGTMAAVNNSAGVFGVAYNAKIWVARVLGTQSDGSVSGTTSQVMDGVKWLANTAGCKVINMSLGGSSRSKTEENLYKSLYNNGTLIVAAAGNDGANHLGYPAGYTVVLSVGAVDAANTVADFSNRGRGLDISAPGVLVLSSVPDGQGSEASVTSGSTYRAFGLEFAGKTAGYTDTLVNCGLASAPSDCVGKPADGTWVALIRRGTNTFAEKVENAMAAGADAAILYNNVAGDFVGTLTTEKTSSGGAWIPAVSVSGTAGAALTGQVGASATVANVASSWDHYDGTSMATPHVTGVADLVLQKKPSISASALEAALKSSATDLGAAGYDTTYGYGLVNATGALAAVTP